MKLSLLLLPILVLTACGGKSPSTPTPPLAPIASPAGFGTAGPGPAVPINSQGGNGFYTLQAANVPAAIQQAGSSVYMLRFLGARADLRVIDVRNGGGQKAKADIMALDEASADSLDKDILIKQVERCENDKDPENQKECILNADISRATGFLAKDNLTLWTTAHSVDSFMKLIEVSAKISKADQLRNKQRVAVFVYDSTGKLVVNPYTNPVKIKSGPTLTAIANINSTFYGEDSDYISLSLSSPIGTPLRFAKNKPVVGQKVFLLGYPACTACSPKGIEITDPEDFADRSPMPNSDGNGLKMTFGTVLPNVGLESFFQISKRWIEVSDIPHMIFSTADAQHGMSGGPLLNEQGEVVGVHGGGLGRHINGVLTRVSRATIPN